MKVPLNVSGALVKVEGYDPSLIGPVVYFSVDDIKEILSKNEGAWEK